MRILVLAPHTDDGEFGCGATIAKYIAEEHDVHYVAFSSAEGAVPDGFPSSILRDEVREATRILGVPEANLRILNFAVRQFPAHRQEILDAMVRLAKDLKPDVVYLPSTEDTHQDHQTVSSEGFRAFKGTSLLGYELPWNNLSFLTTAFVVVEREFIEKKVEAIRCYKSQSDRAYASETFARSLASVRGVQIGVEYAEAFQAIRVIRRGTSSTRFMES